MKQKKRGKRGRKEAGLTEHLGPGPFHHRFNLAAYSTRRLFNGDDEQIGTGRSSQRMLCENESVQKGGDNLCKTKNEQRTVQTANS
jgi:hypothetical protein